MKLVFLLPHGWGFAAWKLSDVLARYHFSTHYAQALSRRGHEVVLLLVHESLSHPVLLQTQPYRVEAFPVSVKLPFLRFGGEISLSLVKRVARLDAHVLHIHGCFYEALPLLVLLSRAPVLLQWHGGTSLPFHTTALRLAYRKVQRVIIPFRGVTHVLKGIFPNEGMYDVVPLPLRAEISDAPPKEKYSSIPTHLLYVGRIPSPQRTLWERRVDLLIKLLAHLRSTRLRLDVVGDGPGRPYCERLAQSEGIASSITFHGFKDLLEVIPMYRDADLTVVPFAPPDLTGTWVAQVQESLALGTPVIAFSPSGDLIEHETGWRISPHPPSGAEHLARILSDADAIQTKGRRASEIVRSACGEQTVFDTLETVYERVVGGG